MKTALKVLSIGLAAGVISMAAQAQEVFKVTLNLTATVQSDSTDLNGVTKTPPPTKFHLGNKQILDRIATDHGTNYPSNAKLAVSGNGFVIVDPDGNILDSIPEMTITFSDRSVTSGSRNDDNLSGTTKSQQIITITFDDTGDGAQNEPIQFSASGLFRGSSTISKPNGNGDQTVSGSGSGTLAGEGTAEGKNMVVTGSISGSGKGPFVL